VSETASATKPRVADPVHQLRRALRQWHRATVAEAAGLMMDAAGARQLYREVTRLWNRVGPTFADCIISEEAERFGREAGACGWCGGKAHPSEAEQ
jgi:hypothetical protein